jgi:hypothetical protein
VGGDLFFFRLSTLAAFLVVPLEDKRILCFKWTALGWPVPITCRSFKLAEF